MMTSDRTTIDRIREVASIVEAVGSFTTVKASGSKHVALCPLPGHKEKTPSFTMDDHLGLFHCFGCGRGGDIFKFYMLMENFTFGETLEFLARKHGVPIIRKAPRPGEISKVVLEEILSAVSSHYRKCLLKSPNSAADYLMRRKLDRDQWDAWELGYAPEGYDTIRRALGSKITECDLVQAGVLIPGQQGAYDRFRNRLIFPIRDALGHLVGLAGRSLGDEMPKYTNTPETVGFKKGNLLYALDRARKNAGSKGHILVVEGYFDCIRLHTAGFDTAVATMGTALSPTHGKLLKKAAPRLVLCFDGDDAGQKAASGALKNLLPYSLGVELVFLPQEEDPDSLIAGKGAEAFKVLFDAREDFFDFFYRKEFSTAPARLNPGEKSSKVKNIMELLNFIPDPVLQYAYTSRLAERTGIAEKTLQKVLKSTPAVAEEVHHRELPDAEKVFLSRFLQNEKTFLAFRERFHPGLFETPDLRALAEHLIEEGLDKWEKCSHIIQQGHDISGLLSELFLSPEEEIDLEHYWRNLQLRFQKKELVRLRKDLALAGPEEAGKLLVRTNDVLKDIQALQRMSNT